MSVSVISTGYRALAPSGTLTLAATREGAILDQRLRELYEKFEPHRAILASLAQRIDDLRTWGTGWEEYDAAPPTSGTVDRAHQWIKDFYLDILTSGRTWIDPLITAGEDGEAMFEWQRRDRRLTVRVTETEV